VISELPEQKKIEGLGGTMRLGGQQVIVQTDSLAHFLYRTDHVRERFRHRWEVEPRYVDDLQAAGLRFSGRHPSQPIMQVLELPQGVHPYFIAAQFHPELTSRCLAPNPLFAGLAAAAIRYRHPDYAVNHISERWLRPFDRRDNIPVAPKVRQATPASTMPR